MKLILAAIMLLLRTALAVKTGQTLKCYGSNGWKNLESVKFEKEQCGFSRCFAATSKDFFKLTKIVLML
jgi:hypothetical protein